MWHYLISWICVTYKGKKRHKDAKHGEYYRRFISDLSFDLFYNPPLPPAYKQQNPISALRRSRTALVIEVATNQRNRSFSVFCSLNDDSTLNPEEESKDFEEQQVASIDIKLPRTSLLVEFSCTSCGERTKRLINRHAYERGLVFVQDVFDIIN